MGSQSRYTGFRMSMGDDSQSQGPVRGRAPAEPQRDTSGSWEGRRWWLSFWLPMLFFLFSTAVLLFSWRAFLHSEASAKEMETRVTTEQVKLRLEAWMQTRLAVVEQMGSHWVRDFQGHPEEFRKAAGDLIDLYPGFQALNWIDESWFIRITVPEAGNEAALGKDLHRHQSPGVPASLERATGRPGISLTPVISLLQGGRGIASYRRVRGSDGKILGYINGVFRIDTLVDACLAEKGLRDRFHFQILDENGSVAYSHGIREGGHGGKGAVSSPVRVGDRVWELQMARNQGVPNGKGEALAAVLLACALLFAAILSLALSALIRRHQEYQKSVETFRRLLEHLRDLVIRMDGEGHVLYASAAYRSLLGREQALDDHDPMLFIHGGDREARDETIEKLREPPHLCSIEQRILSARSWHRISWKLVGVPGEDGGIRRILALGREEDVETNSGA